MAKIGFLNSNGPRDLSAGTNDPFVRGFRTGLGDPTHTYDQETAEYGNNKRKRNLLRKAAETLLGRNVDLIVATGGIVSARAAAAEAARKDKPVLVCIGKKDPSLDDFDKIAGVALNAPAANNYRATLLASLGRVTSEDNIWLVVNSNSAMGKAEKDQWDNDGRPSIETGRDGENKEGGLRGAFILAKDSGAEAFVISSDPFFTSKAQRIINILKSAEVNLPACFPFKRYVDLAPGSQHLCWGHDLEAVYTRLGEQAKKIFQGTSPFEVVSMLPERFDPPQPIAK